jgi:hypothetical protein
MVDNWGRKGDLDMMGKEAMEVEEHWAPEADEVEAEVGMGAAMEVGVAKGSRPSPCHRTLKCSRGKEMEAHQPCCLH